MSNTQDVKNLGTIMGVWAHPDDETFSMGGIMANAVENGQKVVCITATRGEAGVQDESRWPAHKLAAIRTKELETAYSVLGIQHHYWLDYPDGGCADVDIDEATKRIAKLIAEHQPDSIFTFGPDGMTGHSDHQTVSLWTTKAVALAQSNATIYHATITNEQYTSMLEADKELNIFFNIEKPPLCDECDCDLCFTLPSHIYDKKIKALEAMPSQTEKMLQKFSDVLSQSHGTETFVRATP